MKPEPSIADELGDDEVSIDRRPDAPSTIEIDLQMESESNLYVGLDDDITGGGLFVATHELLPLDESVELRFQLPGDDEPLRVAADVRWHRTVSNPDEGVTPGFGAGFTDLDEDDRRRLEHFAECREPMFHPR